MGNSLLGFITTAAATVSVLAGTALASRPCDAASSPYKWSILEWTYDGPNKNATGLAAVLSTVGFFVTTGRTYWSCESSWPEAQAGWSADGTELLWSDCLDTGAGGSRGADASVVIAVDFKKSTVYLSHTFACSDKPGTNLTATGTAVLDVQCDGAEKPSRCTSKVARIDVDTVPVPTP